MKDRPGTDPDLMPWARASIASASANLDEVCRTIAARNPDLAGECAKARRKIRESIQRLADAADVDIEDEPTAWDSLEACFRHAARAARIARLAAKPAPLDRVYLATAIDRVRTGLRQIARAGHIEPPPVRRRIDGKTGAADTKHQHGAIPETAPAEQP